jgi:tyrosyl-tRNA synthetase
MMLPLLEGLDGVRKMSKSYGNYVAFNDTPADQFGKLMSIPDSLMPKYAELLTEVDVPALQKMHPREAKALLARTITAFFYGDKAATKASDDFDRVFSRKEIPEQVPEFQTFRGVHKASDLLVAAGMAPSKKEAQRLLAQGAIDVDGKKLAERDTIDLQVPVLVQVGKRRFVKVIPG